MPSGLNQYLENLKVLYDKLTRQQKLYLGGAVFLVIIGMIGFLFYAEQPSYVVLYSNLMKSDSQAITQVLNSKKIPYQLKQNGSTILVPASDVDQLRIKLAEQGLPTSYGVGLEFLTKPSLYETSQTLKLQWLRAQQVELERTISQIRGIQWARVDLVPQKNSIFITQTQPATAAVEIQMTPGASLRKKQVHAIIALVAHSVRGLKPENVTVIDTNGNLLSAVMSQGTSPANMSLSQLQIEQQFNMALQQRLQSLLNNTFGYTLHGFPKAFVQVKAQLNFDFKTIDQTTYIPQPNGKGVIRSQQTEKEFLHGKNPSPGGIPGVSSNVKIPSYPTTKTAPIGYTKEQQTTNYEITTQKESIKPPVGVYLKRLHLAVAVDSSPSANLQPGDVAKIKSLIASAAGFNPKRGDTLSVESYPFDHQYFIKQEQKRKSQKNMRNFYAFMRWLLIFVLLAALLGFVVYTLIKRGPKAEEKPLIQAPPPFPPEFLVPPPPISEEKFESKKFTEKFTEKLREKGGEQEALQEEIQGIINENPGVAAEIVRSWLSEREHSEEELV